MAEGNGGELRAPARRRQYAFRRLEPRHQHDDARKGLFLNPCEIQRAAQPAAAGSARARCGIRWIGVCAALDQRDLGDQEAIMNHVLVDASDLIDGRRFRRRRSPARSSMLRLRTPLEQVFGRQRRSTIVEDIGTEPGRRLRAAFLRRGKQPCMPTRRCGVDP